MTDQVTGASEPVAIWEPAADWRTSTRIGRYVEWLAAERGRQVEGYDDLWRWSVDDLAGFWRSIWDHFGVQSDTPATEVLADAAMPGAQWFPGTRISYARHVLTPRDGVDGVDDVDPDDVAVVGISQTREQVDLTWRELREQVARARAGLVALGVGRGDRVVGYLPNIPETIVAFLATASLGAVWAGCAPEFGARSVVDRFAQVEPSVLLVVGGYRYGAKDVDKSADVAAIRAGLPTLRHVVEVAYSGPSVPDATTWESLLGSGPAPDLAFETVPFDHPLVVLFSSGTTGRPKPIVHGHGGILLEHLKNHTLSWDLGPGDRILWFTTTAWMMWNSLVSGLAVHASVVTVDGNPMHPDPDVQWSWAAETGATLMGASPAFLMASRAAGSEPARRHDLSRLRQLGAAGSPLPEEGFTWVAQQLPGVLLNVGSGGTDVCSGIVQGSPLQPVWPGEISGPSLGVAAAAYDEAGRPVVGELGELVITAPMPSMPVGFWGDDDGSRYRAAYFEQYPGIWRHGDWVRFSARGSCVISGRSDATLNRGGVRLGTAELYRVVEELPEVEDSLVVHLEDPQGGNGELVLLVVLADGTVLDDDLRRLLATSLRTALSPRHVPDTVVAIAVVPRNRTGKKLELPVKQVLLGRDPAEVATPGSLAVPGSIEDCRDAYLRARAEAWAQAGGMR